MEFKRIFAVLLVLCLALGLCACGGSGNEETKPTSAETTGAAEETTGTTAATQAEEDGKVSYTVKVVDEDGNPISGAMVQLCKETCLPGATNAEGVAEFRTVEDEYKVSFMTVPEGYAAEAEEFYFEDGSFELTITLKAAA